MIKKIAFTGLVVLLLVILLPAGMTAGSTPSVTSSSVDVNFPASLTFHVTASSDANITDVRLHYVVNRMSHAQIVSEIAVPVSPGKNVTAEWLWDMRMSGGMPPGSSIDYWWTISDAGGGTLETAPARAYMEDDRYDWGQITRGNVTLYWYEGDNAFAGDLMDAVDEALSRLAANTGAELTDPVRLYIYASSEDLRGSMIFPQEWTGGVAFTEYGVVTIGIPPNASGLDWGKGAITHELTHLVVHQVTFNPYNSMPTWLDEGLAMTSEGELDAQFLDTLSSAISNDALISVRSLASPFSAYSYEAILSYAESAEVVTYLIDTYGRDKMFQLLNAFAQGSGYDEALTAVYGLNMDTLNAAWLVSLDAAVP